MARVRLRLRVSWLVLALVAEAGVARAEDTWWGRDKALHFGVSVGLGGGSYAAASPWLERRWQRAAFGGAVTVAAGAAKETYDALGPGVASGRDLAWGAAGAAVGVALASGIDWLVRGPRQRPAAP